MKEFIIIFLVLLIIILGDIGIQYYLNSSSAKLVNSLKEIKKLLDSKENSNMVNEKCNKLYYDWKKTEKRWSIIVLHSELDLIEQALIETKGYILENDIGQGKVGIEKSIFLIEHIPDKEALSLKNIF